jgi:hypothetical protein
MARIKMTASIRKSFGSNGLPPESERARSAIIIAAARKSSGTINALLRIEDTEKNEGR